MSGAVRADLHNPALSAYDRLVAHVRGLTWAMASDTDRRGCLMAKSADELFPAGPDVAKPVKRTLDGWLRELTATITAAQADGDIPAGSDAKALASLLSAVLRGMEGRAQGRGGGLERRGSRRTGHHLDVPPAARGNLITNACLDLDL
ncbi:TetR family transcriptional regulator C-terminal domain-containing protein [Mycolicibacterium frederiksbergense]